MKLNRVQYKSFSGLFDDSEEERLFAKFPGIKAAKIGRRSGGSSFRSTNRTLNKPTSTGGGAKPPAKPVSPVQPAAQPKQNPTYTMTGGSGNGSSTYYVGGTSTSAGSGATQLPYFGGGSSYTNIKTSGTSGYTGSTGLVGGGTGTKPPTGGGGYAGSAGLGNNGGITGGPASDFAAASTKTGTGSGQSGQGGYAAMAGQGKSPTTITGGPASDFAAAQSANKTGTGQGNTGGGLNYTYAPPQGGRKSLGNIVDQRSKQQPQASGGVDPNYRYTSTTSTAGTDLNYTNAPQNSSGGYLRRQQQQSQVKPQAKGGGQSNVDPAAAAAGKQRRNMTNERKRVARQSYDAGYQKGMNSANEQISQMQSQLDAANNAAAAAQANTGISQGIQNTWNNSGFMTKAGMLGATGAGLYFLGKGVMDTVDGNGQDRQRY